MTAPRSLVRQSLEIVGLGPERMTSALGGAELFGTAGILNSLELVQFIAALSEHSRVDAFELMDSFESEAGNIFRNVDALCAFLDRRAVVALEG
ncbi:hypothetical protein TSH100_15200 [Azospirillum sp. TSH100]|uniref:hypothetical protein n=1 Tax=unclassified Azospirillum TaxID=2630922 RepID=UPI000D606EF9|nr:hypothetical protein [Azospirillum sp. TSH100]PWC85498.1 hypothetical protein TSH100_15200 [Azospirillum sp. TSH100]